MCSFEGVGGRVCKKMNKYTRKMYIYSFPKMYIYSIKMNKNTLKKIKFFSKKPLTNTFLYAILLSESKGKQQNKTLQEGENYGKQTLCLQFQWHNL